MGLTSRLPVPVLLRVSVRVWLGVASARCSPKSDRGTSHRQRGLHPDTGQGNEDGALFTSLLVRVSVAGAEPSAVGANVTVDSCSSWLAPRRVGVTEVGPGPIATQFDGVDLQAARTGVAHGQRPGLARSGIHALLPEVDRGRAHRQRGLHPDTGQGNGDRGPVHLVADEGERGRGRALGRGANVTVKSLLELAGTESVLGVTE